MRSSVCMSVCVCGRAYPSSRFVALCLYVAVAQTPMSTFHGASVNLPVCVCVCNIFAFLMPNESFVREMHNLKGGKKTQLCVLRQAKLLMGVSC